MATINDGLILIQNNIQMDLGLVILIVMMIGCLIFYAVNFKLGAIFTLLSGASSFMISYKLDFNWAPSLVVMFLGIIFMVFSMYSMNKTAPGVA